MAQGFTNTLDIADNSITNAKLRDSAALSVIGRSANSTGDPADIAGATVGHVLQVLSGPTVGFGTPGSFANAKTPTDISGLYLWLKADAGAYNDAGVTLATNGQTVQQWNDQSGGNRHVSQATAGKRPTYNTGKLNSLPAIQFTAAHCLTLASAAISTFSLLVAFRASGTAGALLEHGPSTATNDGFLLHTSQTTISVKKGGVLSARNSDTGWGVTNTWMITFQRYAGTHSLHQFGLNQIFGSNATVTGNEPGTSTVTDTLNIGARNDAASLALTGDIAEIILYTPYINMADMVSVYTYLRNKWDI